MKKPVAQLEIVGGPHDGDVANVDQTSMPIEKVKKLAVTVEFGGIRYRIDWKNNKLHYLGKARK